jgi:hypothetical protein
MRGPKIIPMIAAMMEGATELMIRREISRPGGPAVEAIASRIIQHIGTVSRNAPNPNHIPE